MSHNKIHTNFQTDTIDYIFTNKYKSAKESTSLYCLNNSFSNYNISNSLTEKYNSGIDISEYIFFDLNKPEENLKLYFHKKEDTNKTAKTTTIKQKDSDVKFKEKTYTNFSGEWILGSIIVGLLIIARIKYYSKNYISDIFISAFNYKFSNSLYREFSNISKSSNFLLSILFYINSSLFVVISLRDFDIKTIDSPLILWSTILVSIMSANIFHIIINILIGNIFKISALFKEYNFNINIYNRLIGLLLLPIIAIIQYSDIEISQISLKITIIIFFIIHIQRTLRIFRLFSQKHISYFYLFLYLCTLEIIPILIVIRLIINII